MLKCTLPIHTKHRCMFLLLTTRHRIKTTGGAVDWSRCFFGSVGAVKQKLSRTTCEKLTWAKFAGALTLGQHNEEGPGLTAEGCYSCTYGLFLLLTNYQKSHVLSTMLEDSHQEKSRGWFLPGPKAMSCRPHPIRLPSLVLGTTTYRIWIADW